MPKQAVRTVREVTYRARARIELPDVPGALVAVATAIARTGANIVSVDVHSLEGGRACDELLLDLPDHVDSAVLTASLSETRAGSLVGLWPGDRTVDPFLLALRAACGVVGVGETAAEEELVGRLAQVCGTSAVWLLEASAASTEPGRSAVATGRPVVLRTNNVPAELAPGPVSEWWLLAVPDARLDPRRVAFVARPIGNRFTATEVARVEALLGYVRLLTGLGLLGAARQAVPLRVKDGADVTFELELPIT